MNLIRRTDVLSSVIFCGHHDIKIEQIISPVVVDRCARLMAFKSCLYFQWNPLADREIEKSMGEPVVRAERSR